jgi:hypothetical protein
MPAFGSTQKFGVTVLDDASETITSRATSFVVRPRSPARSRSMLTCNSGAASSRRCHSRNGHLANIRSGGPSTRCFRRVAACAAGSRRRGTSRARADSSRSSNACQDSRSPRSLGGSLSILAIQLTQAWQSARDVVDRAPAAARGCVTSVACKRLTTTAESRPLPVADPRFKGGAG